MQDTSDQDEFIKEFADIKPLAQDKIAPLPAGSENVNAPYRRRIATEFSRRDTNFLTELEVDWVEPEAILSFKVDGVQPGVFKKLRQGKYSIDFHLDLHRKTVAEARQEVYQLLVNACRRGKRALLITHGKGVMGDPPAKLKSYVNHWLKQVENVLAFHSAQPFDGGNGSVYVLLKKSPDQSVLNQAKYD